MVPVGLVDVSDSVRDVIASLDRDAGALLDVDLDGLSDRELLVAVRDLEVAGRRLDAAKDRLAGHLDRTRAFREDGHRTAKAAVKHLGRLPGAEAHARVLVERKLRRLPKVADAYRRGEIPTASVRAVARVASNPRVIDFLDDADPVFAEMAASEPYDDFVRWLAAWEALADADGAADRDDAAHRRRHASLVQHPDGTWHLRGSFGALQGAAMREVLAAYQTAQFETDRAEAIATHGDDVGVEQFPRTAAQRRADAVFEIFRSAGSTPADAQAPEPLVNIVIDLETFEDELRRICGDPTPAADPNRAAERICQTLEGDQLHPSDAVLAVLLGTVRRVVVDAASTVIDLGRRRRCFTGNSRDAALLQAALRARGGQCIWASCDCTTRYLQIDHDRPWRLDGRTDVQSSNGACGHHNRLKELGFRPVRGPDGTYTYLRPDGTSITPSA